MLVADDPFKAAGDGGFGFAGAAAIANGFLARATRATEEAARQRGAAKIVTADLKWEASILARVDLGNGYAIFDSTNRKILLYDSTSTLLTSSAVNSLPAADDAMYAVEVCYYDGALTATMNSVCVDDLCTDVSSPFVYLGSDSGTVHFDNFVFKKHYDTSEPSDAGCDKCECTLVCSYCLNDAQPSLLLVEHPAYVGSGCTTCDNLPNVLLAPFSGGNCPWGATDNTTECGGTVGRTVTADVVLSGADYKLSVQTRWTDGALYDYTFNFLSASLGTTKPDCMTFDRVECFFDSHTQSGTAVPCDDPVDSAFVTSL